MEIVVDKLIDELDTLKETAIFQTVMVIDSDVKWDDPGIVMVDEYPYIYVEPVQDSPATETVGRAGYDVRDLTINIGVVINQSDFFDPSVSEMPGSRPLIQVMSKIRSHLRRLSKSQLDGTVRRLAVANIMYTSDVRDDTFVRVAIMTLVVQKQYQHEE